MDKITSKIDISDLNRIYDEYTFNSTICECMGDFLNYGYWDENTPNQKIACENLMEKLLAFITDKTGNILDVACGKGGTTRHLLKYYQPQDVTGINISERQLEAAQANAPGCTFLLMNATDLAFPDASFNNIICVEAAFHFYTRQKFFQEAYRVLKPGGTLVLSDILMNMEADRRRKLRTEKNYISGPQEYGNVLNMVGFQEIQIIDATKPCWEGHFLHFVQYLREKSFSQDIDLKFVQTMLERTHQVVPDIEYYLLAAARKC